MNRAITEFQYCPRCGTRLADSDIDEGGVLRCPDCRFNIIRRPVIGVGVVVLDGKKVVLGRRTLMGGRRYQGHWCIPCGYLEWGEEVRAAAAREFLEETGLEVEIVDVYAVHSNFHNPNDLTVGIWFKGSVVGGALQAGDDLDMVGYFPLDDLPEPIAFPTDRLVLEQLRRELG